MKDSIFSERAYTKEDICDQISSRLTFFIVIELFWKIFYCLKRQSIFFPWEMWFQKVFVCNQDSLRSVQVEIWGKWMIIIQPTMKVLKVSELTDLKQKQEYYYHLKEQLTASLGICSIHAKKTQLFATVGEVENEDIRL